MFGWAQKRTNYWSTIRKKAPKEIHGQLDDNIKWIEDAKKNNLVVGSKARILFNYPK